VSIEHNPMIERSKKDLSQSPRRTVFHAANLRRRIFLSTLGTNTLRIRFDE